MAKKNHSRFEYDTDAIARRLKVIRVLKAGKNQSEFARVLDITQTRWNNLEHGYPLNLRICALLMAAVPGLSIDWIVKGLPHNMPPDLAGQLSSLERDLFPPGSPKDTGGSRKR